MCHRIGEAMKKGGVLPPLGGKGKHVEADETYIGNKDGVTPMGVGFEHKRVVLSLVKRGGEVRSFHIDRATIARVAPIVAPNLLI
jgi:hypothetical protein